MRVIGVNELNIAVGQDNPSADLTDREVELMRSLRETEGWTYDRLAEKFECSKSLVAMICRYERRVIRPVAWREVVPACGSKSERRAAPARVLKCAARRSAFLDALARTGVVAQACSESGLDSTSVYSRRRTDPEFADAWLAALARFPSRWPQAAVHRPNRIEQRATP